MGHVERRMINRVCYPSGAVVVICDTQEKIYVSVENISPLGIGLRMKPDAPDISGKDIIIVTETLIMYADVVWRTPQEGGSYNVGIAAKKFTEDVLQYLFDNIALKEDEGDSK